MPDLYLIEKRGLYYRPSAQGYTCFKHEAGQYTLNDVAVHFPNHDSPNQDGMTFIAFDDAPDVSKAGGFEGRLRFELYQATQRAEKAEAALAEKQELFDRLWEADMRGIKMWQEANPGNDLVLPDRAQHVAWVLDHVAKLDGVA